MRRVTAVELVSLLLLVLLLTGCPKRYNVKAPDEIGCSGSPNCDLTNSSAWNRPRCEPTQPYALLNSGLTYLPFHSISSCVGATEDERPQEIPLLPGMRLRISGFAMRPDSQNTEVPIMSSFEWTVPRQNQPGQKTPPPTRLDYLFLSYLLNAAFPENTNLFNLRAELGKIATCTPRPKCRDDRIRSALASLHVYVTADIAPPIASRSAGSIREWLNPSEPSGVQTTQHLSLKFDDINLVLFSEWENQPYFTSEATEAQKRNKTNPSTAYATDSPIYTGHSLVTIDVPVRINNEFESRYFPVYWSLADVERRLGVMVVGLRRQKDFLSPQLGGRLIPAENGPGDIVSSSDYFTVWLQKPGSFVSSSYISLGAKGYVFPFADRSPNAVALLKEQSLIAPGDVLIVGKRDNKEATDNPGYR